MNNNFFIYDLLRSRWMISGHTARDFEKMTNAALEGKLPSIDRANFKASYMQDAVQKTDSSAKKIAFLQMVGPMFTYGSDWFFGADDYVDALRYLNENNQVSAIVLEIDGPGGAASAIQAFKEFRSEKQKPIVVLCNTLCSLHYWLAVSLADHIMAKGNISPVIGSIGTAYMTTDAREAMTKDGYKVMLINAEGSELKNKAMQDFYEGKDEEFISRIKAELKPVRDIFVADVKAAMPNISDDARIFAGDTFSAEEALELKMIHSIGSTRDAFVLADALAQLQN